MEVKEITIELIEKNGFKKFVAEKCIFPMESKEIFVCITPMESKEIFVCITPMGGVPNANGKWLVVIKNGYTDAKIVITYVYELQQALTLCGVEKTIEV